MTDNIVVLSTCSSIEEAERIARGLLEARLAACVNVLTQNRSFYRWKDKIEDSAETLLIIKTNRALFPELRTVLESAHSYEVPEVLALPIVEGSPNYLSWLAAELRNPND